MRGVVALGPIFAGPAVRHWVLATPVDRPALLTPRYLAVAAAVALGAGTVALAAVVAEATEPLWWPVTGAGVAAGLFAAAVLLQTGPAAVGRVVAIGVASAGAVLAGAALVAAPDATLPALPGSVVAVAAAVLAGVLLVAGTATARTARPRRARRRERPRYSRTGGLTRQTAARTGAPRNPRRRTPAAGVLSQFSRPSTPTTQREPSVSVVSVWSSRRS